MTKKMTNMNFDELSQEAYATAKAHGWHDIELPNETYLMLIITEIAEAVQADRKDKHAYKDKFLASLKPDDDGDMFSMLFGQYIKNSVEDELSDIVIRCLDMSGLRGIGFDLTYKLLDKGMQEVKETFPEVMYHLCTFISSDGETLRDKLNYCMALIIGYCKQKDIDIEFFIEQKMKYNKLRPFRHGNKKY